MTQPYNGTLTFDDIVGILEEAIEDYEKEDPYEELDFNDVYEEKT